MPPDDDDTPLTSSSGEIVLGTSSSSGEIVLGTSSSSGEIVLGTSSSSGGITNSSGELVLGTSSSSGGVILDPFFPIGLESSDFHIRPAIENPEEKLADYLRDRFYEADIPVDEWDERIEAAHRKLREAIQEALGVEEEYDGPRTSLYGHLGLD